MTKNNLNELFILRYYNYTEESSVVAKTLVLYVKSTLILLFIIVVLKQKHSITLRQIIISSKVLVPMK